MTKRLTFLKRYFKIKIEKRNLVFFINSIFEFKAASLVEKIRRNKGIYDTCTDSDESEREAVKVERKPLMPPKPTTLSLQRMV